MTTAKTARKPSRKTNAKPSKAAPPPGATPVAEMGAEDESAGDARSSIDKPAPSKSRK